MDAYKTSGTSPPTPHEKGFAMTPESPNHDSGSGATVDGATSINPGSTDPAPLAAVSVPLEEPVAIDPKPTSEGDADGGRDILPPRGLSAQAEVRSVTRPEGKEAMTGRAWFEQYLTSRGIDLKVAEAHGVKLLDGDEINAEVGRTDGAMIEFGIRFPTGEVRCYRTPDDEGGDLPENTNYKGEPKRVLEVACEAKPAGLYRVGDQIARVTEKGEVWRSHFYGFKGQTKFLFKKGVARELYAPERATIGGRKLLVVEGSTRVLAALSHRPDREQFDVVGLPSAMPSEDNLEELLMLSATATRVVVVLDGDVVENVNVGRGLNRICAKLYDESVPMRVRVGIPGGGKDGLDDMLAKYPDHLEGFIFDALPWDPMQALSVLRQEQYEKDAENTLHVARAAKVADGIMVAARHWSFGGLVYYARVAKALRALDLDPPEWPEEDIAGSLFRPKNADVADVFKDYILPGVPYVVTKDGKGRRTVAHVEDEEEEGQSEGFGEHGSKMLPWESLAGLCTPMADEAADRTLRDRLDHLIGSAPTAALVNEAHAQLLLSEPEDVVAVRRFAGSDLLAYSQLPLPLIDIGEAGKKTYKATGADNVFVFSSDSTELDQVKVNAGAWEELMARMSSRTMFLLWVHTLTIDDFAGRQSLYLRGEGGQDGKSTFCQVLMDVFRGPLTNVAVMEARIEAESRFQWAKLRPWTRLFVMDDVLNPKLFFNQQIRNLASGGVLNIERKGLDAVNVEVHARVLITSNQQLEYYDGPSRSRIIQVDLEPRADKFQDGEFKQALARDLPLLLGAAQVEWDRGERLKTRRGDEIIPDAATVEVMKAGATSAEEQFASAIAKLEFDPGAWTSNAELRRILFPVGGIQPMGGRVTPEMRFRDFCSLLRGQHGCQERQRRVDTKREHGHAGVRIRPAAKVAA